MYLLMIIGGARSISKSACAVDKNHLLHRWLQEMIGECML